MGAVVDWEGYTIGYFGRPFETRKLAELDNIEKDFFRFVVGKGSAIPALEEGVQGMQAGGVRQLVFGIDLSYPASDMGHDVVGPKPLTLSGQRALNFVLENPRIDRTLLVNVKLVRIDKGYNK